MYLVYNKINHDNKKNLTSNTCPLVFRRGYIRGFYIGETTTMKNIIDLSGQRFGKLTVISFNKKENGHYYWNCVCDCGKECIKDGGKLRRNETKSCGCLRVEKNSKHHNYKTRLYRIYNGMKYRCNLETDTGYKWYGSRGIKVCEEWMKDYQSFKNWALNNGYADDLTIDRIDNNGDYEPLNCRWVSVDEQQQNTRRTMKIEYQGLVYSMRKLAKKFNINHNTLYGRLKRGWSIEKALTPPRKYEVLNDN